MHFADRLYERMDKVQSRLVIGIDPDPKRLFGKDSLFGRAYAGLPRESILDEFCNSVISAAEGTACAVKPQAAFFESMGLSGLKSLARCMQQARQRGIPVILDAKRGDIGNTASAYASAYLDPMSEFFADALTVNPYLGPDTLEPFVDAASNAGCGLFILVKTSNPGSGAFQDALLKDGSTLFMKVAASVKELGASHLGEWGYSNVGAVVGATYPEELRAIREALPDSIFLLPGYGAQGGTADDVRSAFNRGGRGAIVSSSRGIIFAHERMTGRPSPERIRQAMLEAAVKAQKDIQQAAGFTG
jgi:orotidine-5'-phosphate decarboxylase